MKTQNVDNIYRVYCDDNQAYQGRKVFVTKDFFYNCTNVGPDVGFEAGPSKSVSVSQ